MLGRSEGVSRDLDAQRPRFPALRFMAGLKAARDFGLDQGDVNAVALSFDPREPDVGAVADALAAALLRQHLLALPDAV
jgi:hypothetical protein